MFNPFALPGANFTLRGRLGSAPGSEWQAAPPKVGESSRFALSPREPSTLIFMPFVRDTGLWWQFRRANGYRGSAFTGDPKPDTKRRQRDRSVFESGVIKSVSIHRLPLTRDRLSDALIGKVE